MAALTELEIEQWLASPSSIRGVLVEVSVLLKGATTDSTLYLSSFSYTTSPTDTPSNQYYEPIVIGGFKYTEKLSVEGKGGLSLGDIELNNTTGEFDEWLGHTFVNRSIKVYVGDPQWQRDEFFLVFDGVVSDIDSRARGTLNIKLKDKLARLNTPIFELKYADIAPYPDASNVTPYRDATDPVSTVPDQELPVVFGECHNITPVFIDSGNLVYLCHYGPIKGIIEVRDNGVPLTPSVGYTADLTKGTVTMLFQPAGTITISVQGDNVSQPWDTFEIGTTYRHTVGSIIRRIVTGYGKCVPDPVTGEPTSTPSTERFTEADIDTANFAAFEAAHPQPVGVFSVSRENLLSICQQLAASVGAQLSMTRLGKLRLLKLVSPAVGTPIVIDGSYMMENTLHISKRTDIEGSVNLGFCRNYTQQTGLLTKIPYDHKQLFTEKESTVLKANASVIEANRITGYPAIQSTLLLTQPDAYEEATRRLDLYKVVHNIYKFTGTSELLSLELGDTVQLVNQRFGLTGEPDVGVGTVVSLQPNWITAKIEVEVMV